MFVKVSLSFLVKYAFLSVGFLWFGLLESSPCCFVQGPDP